MFGGGVEKFGYGITGGGWWQKPTSWGTGGVT